MSNFNVMNWFNRKRHDDFQAIRRVYATEDGKALFRVLFAKSGILERSAIDDNPYETYLREGRRLIGIEMKEILDMTNDELTRLLIEEKPMYEENYNE